MRTGFTIRIGSRSIGFLAYPNLKFLMLKLPWVVHRYSSQCHTPPSDFGNVQVRRFSQSRHRPLYFLFVLGPARAPHEGEITIGAEGGGAEGNPSNSSHCSRGLPGSLGNTQVGAFLHSEQSPCPWPAPEVIPLHHKP